jgi:hypothetical protein
VLIENIEYIDYNEIKTTVIAKMINKFNRLDVVLFLLIPIKF